MRKILLLIAFFATGGQALTLNLLNHTGSYHGAVALGLGVAPENQSYRCEILLGYTPEILAGEDLYSLTNKHTFILTPSSASVRLFAGGGAVFSIADEDTFVELPDRYPDKYYPPTGYYFMPYFGIEAGGNSTSLYFEVAALDYYIEALVRGEGRIRPDEIFTYGLGMRARIH